ncbi:GILT-like protein 1 [Plodia interpunctella]|uniref:GILT-like protein 1 n=1 Tax=Plodia interpunctella TaxID=58824 RepID=UPI00236851CA|nr:GILT-like protein 1 [Plodia interpunctella]
MASKIIVAAACLLSLANAELQVVNGKIKITTGTGAFCGDTVQFISQHLGPAYEQYGEFLELEFIPWGRATLNEDGSVTCTWGTNDCWANRLHRCAIDMLKGDQDAQMRYMYCEFTQRPAWLLGSYACAEQVRLNLIAVDYCVNNPNLDTLDADAAAAIAPAMAADAINFVPAIVFNDQIDAALHNEARQRLVSMICFALAEIPDTNVTGCSI